MLTMKYADFASNWKEIATGFLKLGVTAYGGPAIMGLMQVEFQEKRQWLPKERFVEGLSLANLVPGATATQLGIFDGLALGQFTPGPVLMVAAYVGYKVAGFGGAVIAATASFLPLFILMLSVLPVFERVRTLVWTRAAMRGVGPR